MSSKAKVCVLLWLAMSLVWSSLTLGGTQQYWTIVDRVIIDDSAQGGCSIRTQPGPHTTDLACAVNFATLDCEGAFGSKSEAKDKLATAQLAMVLGKYARIVVDDSKKHNGLCLVRRIDATLLNEAP